MNWARRGSHDGFPDKPVTAMPSNIASMFGSRDGDHAAPNLHSKTGRSINTAALERRFGEAHRDSWRCCPTFIDGGEWDSLPEWSSRKKIYKILDSMAVKIIMAVVIVCNSAQVIYECDQSQLCHIENQEASCDRINGWLYQLNWTYLAIYAWELMIRIYVDRMRFFSDRWDIFDFCIVVVGAFSQVIGTELPSTGILRLFRLARLAKAFRWVTLPTELHIMVHGLLTAAKAIIMGTGLIAVMLTLWSVVAVELLNGWNHKDELIEYYADVGCERCPRAWDSVWNATLSFLQTTLMGDSWGTLALPMIERHWWSIFLFVGVPFSIVLGLTNLILAVIVDKALQQHTEDEASRAKARHDEMMIARGHFVELCRVMDVDGSGYLSLEEFLNGYANEQAFKDQLMVMGIGDHELEKLFHVIDKDRSGDVSYEEFAQQLATIKNQDLHAMASFIKAQIMELGLELSDIKEALVPRQDIERMRVYRAPVASTSKQHRRVSVAAVSPPPSFSMEEPMPTNGLDHQALLQDRHGEMSPEPSLTQPSILPRSEALHVEFMDELRKMTEEVRQQAEFQMLQITKQRDWANAVMDRLARCGRSGELPESSAYGTGTGSNAPMGSGSSREAGPPQVPTSPARNITPMSNGLDALKEQNSEALTAQQLYASTCSDSGQFHKPQLSQPNGYEGSVVSCCDSSPSQVGTSNSRRRLRPAGIRPQPTMHRVQDEIRTNLRSLEQQVCSIARQLSDRQVSPSDDARYRLALTHLDLKVSALVRHHGCELGGASGTVERSQDESGWGPASPSGSTRPSRMGSRDQQLLWNDATLAGTHLSFRGAVTTEKPDLNHVNMSL